MTTLDLPTFPDLGYDPGESNLRDQLFWKSDSSKNNLDAYRFDPWRQYYIVTPEAARVIEYMFDHFGPIARVGRHKAVFLDGGGDVIKVPKSLSGIDACNKEVEMFLSPDPEFPVAECMMDWFMGWPIERMERVEPCDLDYDELPDWAYEIDSHQIGLNAAGRLVAYDL